MKRICGNIFACYVFGFNMHTRDHFQTWRLEANLELNGFGTGIVSIGIRWHFNAKAQLYLSYMRDSRKLPCMQTSGLACRKSSLIATTTGSAVGMKQPCAWSVQTINGFCASVHNQAT
ncbi:Hypothetical predicted protein [Podarcis lilfordi]|uniref:Uncharacterized protein n=1 Tax=Podarcis lilfordi TaxID=74358 RepID=A0AA35K9S5_9SAUR|nr:Hypothetical predicted protein [Podarcis lilfordi]